MLAVDNKIVDSFLSSIDWEKVKTCREFSWYNHDCVDLYTNQRLFTICAGTTKMCIIPQNTDYIIKFPLRHVNWGCIQTIKYAPGPISYDYCNTELLYYNLVKESNLEAFFPETIRYPFKDYPIYIQEKCYDMDHTMREWAGVASSDQNGWYSEFHPLWIDSAINRYGRTQLKRLFEFLSLHEICDMNDENYGFSSIDNRPLLIDFSGFYEEDECE